MPKALMAVAPGQFEFVDYEEPPLAPDQVRVVSEFAAAKHGTELSIASGASPYAKRYYDPKLGIFLPLPEGQQAIGFPFQVGNMTLGRVAEAGSGVTRFAVGDRVFGHLGFRETHTVPENWLENAPASISWQQAFCSDPVDVALATVRDADIRIGDTVAIFGLGAIGLFAVQIARLSGARWVAAVDPLANRRALAEQFGANLVLDPTACDVSLEIKRALPRPGVDRSIEASASHAALHEAIRVLGMRGRCCAVGFYQGEACGLRLGEEAHTNAVDLHFSRSDTIPPRDWPLWDRARLLEATFELLESGALDCEGVIDPTVPFEEAADAYRFIAAHPEACIKLGITF